MANRINPEGHEDFYNFCIRKYGKSPDKMSEEEFEIAEDEWLSNLK